MVTFCHQSVSYIPPVLVSRLPPIRTAKLAPAVTHAPPTTGRRRPVFANKPQLPRAFDYAPCRSRNTAESHVARPADARHETGQNLAKIANVLVNLSLLIGLHGQARAEFMPAAVRPETARKAIGNPAAPDAPNIVDPPALETPLAPHRLTQSGLFDADEAIIDDVEAAETYLSHSVAARALFERLQRAQIPIRVSQSSNHSSQSGLGKFTSIQWDNTTYLESHDRIHAEHALPCGTNSAALVFIHEVHHAAWAISNPIGQFALLAMSHPFYDDLEEARVIADVNTEALQLHEDPRGSHRGRLHHADSTFDRHSGICQDLHVLRPDDHLSRLPNASDAEFASNFVTNVPLGKTLFERLNSSIPPVPDVLLDDLSRVFDEHDALAQELIAELKRTNGASVDVALQQRYAEHIRDAIAVTAKFDTGA